MTQIPLFIQNLKLQKPKWFWLRYQSCVRGAKAIKKNAPPTRAKKSQQLRELLSAVDMLSLRLFELEKEDLYTFKGWRPDSSESQPYATEEITASIRLLLSTTANLALSSKHQKIVTAINKVKRRYESLHESVKDQLCLIMQLKSSVDTDLLQAIKRAVNIIGIEKHVKGREHYFWVEVQLAQAFEIAGGEIAKYDDGDFSTLLRQFRKDCGQAGRYPDSVGVTRIKHIMKHIIPKKN